MTQFFSAFLFLLCLNILFIDQTSAQNSTEFNLNSRVDLTEFNGKKVKSKFYCMFSSPNSSVNNTPIHIDRNSPTGQVQQTLSRHGRNYNLREMNWDTSIEGDSFELNFHSDGVQFDDSFNHDEHTCSYRVYRGRVNSGHTTFNGTGLFTVPQGVWVMRVKVNNFETRGDTELQLTQMDFVVNESGNIQIQEVPIRRFNQDRVRYFMINAASSELPNVIRIRVNHRNHVIHRDSDVKLKMQVQFFTQNECLDDLNGSSTDDLLWGAFRNIQGDQEQHSLNQKLEDILIHSACMSHKRYIQYIFNNMMIYNVNSFFENSRAAEDFISQQVLEVEGRPSNPMKDTLENMLSVYQRLIRQVRFYYAFELAKEIYRFLQPQDNATYGPISGLQMLETMRFQSMHYLVSSNSLGRFLLNRIIEQSRGARVSINEREVLDLDIFIYTLIKNEILQRNEMHSYLIVPYNLSRPLFTELERARSALNDQFSQLDLAWRNVREQNESTGRAHLAGIRQLSQQFSQMLNVVREYNTSLENFHSLLATDLQTTDEIIDFQNNFQDQVRLMVQTNIVALQEVLSGYYQRQFEDEYFQNLDINGKKYSTVQDFLNDFNQLFRGDQ